MKSINKLYGIFSALCLLLSFSACTEEVDYSAAEKPNNAQIYFPTTMPAQVDLDRDKNSYDVMLERANADGQVTVNIDATDESGLFTIPASATFEAGEATTRLTIGYDLETLGFENYLPITLTINDESLTTSYGSAKYSFKAGVPAPYTSLGTAKFMDNFLLEGAEYECELMQNDLDPSTYRIMDPFTQLLKDGEYSTEDAQSPYIQFTVMKAGDKLNDVTLTNNDLVFFKDALTGWYYNDGSAKGDVGIYHPSRFVNMSTEDFWLHNKVLMYQEDGKPAVVQLAPYHLINGVGGWNNTQKDGVVIITFPGVVINDYSIELEYMGRLTDPKENNFALANISMGEDLEIVKYAMVEGTDIEAAVNGIIDGSIASEEIEKSGEIKIKSDLSGRCSIVAVGFAEDQPQEMAYTTFEFSTGGAKWESLGMAQYTDDYLASLFNGVEPVTYEVEVLANSGKPGIYRLVNPYGEAYPYNEPGDWDDSQDYYLDINAEDPEGVFIDFQESGLLWTPDPLIFGSMAADYLAAGNSLEDIKAAGLCGTLKDGVITFPPKTLLQIIGSDGYYGNVNGAFKVVLPGATSQAKASACKATTRMESGKAINSGKRTLKGTRFNRKTVSFSKTIEWISKCSKLIL